MIDRREFLAAAAGFAAARVMSGQQTDGIVPSVNLEIYQDVGVGEASLEYMKAVKQEITGKGLIL